MMFVRLGLLPGETALLHLATNTCAVVGGSGLYGVVGLLLVSASWQTPPIGEVQAAFVSILDDGSHVGLHAGLALKPWKARAALLQLEQGRIRLVHIHD